jgi:hypothetical protein
MLRRSLISKSFIRIGIGRGGEGEGNNKDRYREEGRRPGKAFSFSRSVHLLLYVMSRSVHLLL